ncbi:hypothetical protein H5P36_06415 [Bacillus sp. APMAM]|uniref:hypothetical protein n=1 Tax=Margalitia sp. FSL K6-0131 TaxID=2954604 RepID=UPI0016032720|nr:hypothetical protein [Bacillus sp. APMAM]
MSTAPYPICGDPNHYSGYYYCTKHACGTNSYWYNYKIVDDSGDVCSDKPVSCSC